MKDKTLAVVRGLPGSGKTTLARFLAGYRGYAVAADDYFEQEGGYDWSKERLGEAHAWCKAQVEGAMTAGEPLVVVHNTFSRAWEAKDYFDLAEKYGYSVFVIEAQGDFGNVHDVPPEVVERMRLRWESLTRPRIRIRDLIRFRVKGHYFKLRRKLWPRP